MRQTLFISLILSLGLGACADHAGGLTAIDSPTPPPISPSDPSGLEPTAAGSEKPVNSPNSPGGGSGGSGQTGGGLQAGAGGPVPEPGTMLLVGTGLAGAALLRRRRQGKAPA